MFSQILCDVLEYILEKNDIESMSTDPFIGFVGSDLIRMLGNVFECYIIFDNDELLDKTSPFIIYDLEFDENNALKIKIDDYFEGLYSLQELKDKLEIDISKELKSGEEGFMTAIFT